MALSDVLKVAMTEFEAVGHSTSLQPVLVLLASLRPSPELPPSLSECISGIRVHVERVSHCSDVLLSRMAASALAALHPTASAANAWFSYVTRACAAIAHRHAGALKPQTVASLAVSRHVTLGHICIAKALLDAHACSSNAGELWSCVLPPSATLSQALLHALAVASPSEAERWCLMLQSLSKFVNTSAASTSSSLLSAQAAATSSFLSEAASALTERCCAPPTGNLASHSIAACVFGARAISFSLNHASQVNVRRILCGSERSTSLLSSADVCIRRAVLKHCFGSGHGAAAALPLLELLELLVQHLPNETAPPLQRKCLKRVAEVLHCIVRGRVDKKQRPHDDALIQPDPDRVSAAVASVMRHVSGVISQALQHKHASCLPGCVSGNRITLSEKNIQALVCAAAAAAAAAATDVRQPLQAMDGVFQHFFDAVTGSIALSDHPDVAEACAAAVGASAVMQHDVWAGKFSGCLLALVQVYERHCAAKRIFSRPLPVR